MITIAKSAALLIVLIAICAGWLLRMIFENGMNDPFDGPDY